MDHGENLEEFVETICQVAFLRDFVVRSPRYRKGSGVEKEAADLLVPFGEHLLAFQLKTKLETKPGSQKTEVDFARIDKRFETAISQVHTLVRALRAGMVERLENSIGIELPINDLAPDQVIGIVVVELVGEQGLSPEERTAVYNGFASHKGTPVHLFMRDDFDVLLEEVDTLPDFVQYLAFRRDAYEKNRVLGPTLELDLLAFYKTRGREVDEFLADSDIRIVFDEGLWDEHLKAHADEREERARLDGPSYLVDRVIEWLHTSIGYAPEDLAGSAVSLGQGEAETYWASASELARFNRVERRLIGRHWLLKAQQAAEGGARYGYAEFDSVGLVLLASDIDRAERRRRLETCCAVAYCSRGISKILGLATESTLAVKRSYDVLVLEDVEFANHDELAAAAPLFFGSAQAVSEHEFGEPDDSAEQEPAG